MARDLEEDQVHAPVSYETHNGKHIYGPTVPSFNDPEEVALRGGKVVAAAQIRRKFFKMLLRQVTNLGIKVDYSKYVQEYFEDNTAHKGGVVLKTGEIYLADIVVAADGLKSRSEILIAGEHTPAKSSGMSIYRTAYPREVAMRDDTVRKRWGDTPSGWEYWLGPGMYMGVFISPEIVSWGFTPIDTQGNATESWEPDTDPEDVVKALLQVPDWDPVIPALVRTAPRGQIVHWPLLWRDLGRDWTSPGGHVVQVGDSAHSFIPTSGNGATQALEDAVTLATCLQLGGGAGNVTLASKIYNLLRYERVSCGQKMAFVNSQLKTATNWDAIWQDPRQIRTRFPKWLFRHDPEAYAYEKYGQAFAHLVAGADYQNTNFPPGHNFVPWTVEELHKEIERGSRVEDLLDGDWS